MNIQLQNNNGTLSIQKLIFGAGNFDTYQNRSHYFSLLDAYYALGGRCFDTARCYCQWKPGGAGVSETVLGEWIADRGICRQDIIIITKGGFPEPGDMHASRLTRRQLEQDLSESLAALGLSYIDVYLLHRDRPDHPAAEFVDILDDFITDGRIRFGGVSNWTGRRIAEANAYAESTGRQPVSVSQINFSLAHTTPALLKDDTLVSMNEEEAAFYAASRLPVMAYAAQAKGYFPKLAAGLPLSEKARDRYDSPQNRRRFERLCEVAAELKEPVAAVALAFLACHPLSTAAVFSCSTKQQIAESMRACSIDLSQNTINYLKC